MTKNAAFLLKILQPVTCEISSQRSFEGYQVVRVHRRGLPSSRAGLSNILVLDMVLPCLCSGLEVTVWKRWCL